MYKSLSEKNVFTLSVTGQDARYFYVDIKVMRSGFNRNNWDYTQKSIDECSSTFLGTPILTVYKGQQIGGGHDFVETINRRGRRVPDFRGAYAERIVGVVIEDQTVTIQVIDGEKWLVLKGKLFKYYAEQLVEYILENKSMDVSAETDVPEEYQEVLDNGVERFHAFVGLGITILGKNTMPAIDGARIKALARSEEFEKIQLKAASYNAPPNIKINSLIEGGYKSMKKITKKELAILSKKFEPFGTVLGTANGDKFCAVARKDGALQFYPLSMLEEDEGPKEKHFINAALCMTATILQEGETEEEVITCSAEDVIAVAEKQCEELEGEKKEYEEKLSETEKEKEALQEKLNALEQAEKERRCEEMKSAFNSARDKSEKTLSFDEKVDQAKCMELIELIDKGAFDTSVDTTGKFNGVDIVVNKFYAMFGEKQAELREAREAKRNTTIAWKDGGFFGHDSQTDGIAKLVSNFGVNLDEQ